MIKHILIAVTTALLVLPYLSSTTLVGTPEAPDAGTRHPRFSAEDFAAFTDARIAALKSGLQLKPTQEKKWSALETVLREEAKTHAARAAESREKAQEPHEHHDVIAGLRERAKQLEANSVELETIAAEFKKLADAAEPLYESLDDAQKRRFEPLLRKHVGLPDRRLMVRERGPQ
jgi:hypothetical protein